MHVRILPLTFQYGCVRTDRNISRTSGFKFAEMEMSECQLSEEASSLILPTQPTFRRNDAYNPTRETHLRTWSGYLLGDELHPVACAEQAGGYGDSAASSEVVACQRAIPWVCA